MVSSLENRSADVVRVQGRVSWSEYLRAQYLHLRPRPPLQHVGIGIVLLGVVLATAVVARSVAGNPPVRFPYLLVVSLGYLAAYFFVFVPWRARSLFRRQTALHVPFQIQADAGGLEISSELGEVRLPWRILRKWKESRRLFLVYHSDSLFHLIPKRLFASFDDLESFRRLLVENLKRAS